MFKRDKTAKTPKQNEDVVETVTLQQTYLENINDQFAKIERVTDDADKVLSLQGLVRYIDSANDHVRQWRKNIVDNRTRKMGTRAALTGWVGGAAVAAIPIVILAPPLAGLIGTGAVIGMMTGRISTKGRIKKKSEQLVAQNADLNDFQVLITEKRARAAEMLDETVKNCDLEKFPLCPRFQDALMSCVPLRERFAEAATNAAKRVQEEKAAVQPGVADPAKTQRKPRPSNKLKVTK